MIFFWFLPRLLVSSGMIHIVFASGREVFFKMPCFYPESRLLIILSFPASKFFFFLWTFRTFGSPRLCILNPQPLLPARFQADRFLPSPAAICDVLCPIFLCSVWLERAPSVPQ